MKALPWILGVLALAGITISIIFIVKNRDNKRKLVEANAQLSALGGTPVKVASVNPVESGNTTGTLASGTPAGVDATTVTA